MLAFMALGKDIFSWKSVIFSWYLLKPVWGRSKEYPQSTFLSQNKENNVLHGKPHTSLYKVVFSRVFVTQTCQHNKPCCCIQLEMWRLENDHCLIMFFFFFIFSIHLKTVLYPKLCYNEQCFKEVLSDCVHITVEGIYQHTNDINQPHCAESIKKDWIQLLQTMPVFFFSIRLGRFLRQYPIARVFVILYMVSSCIWAAYVLAFHILSAKEELLQSPWHQSLHQHLSLTSTDI